MTSTKNLKSLSLLTILSNKAVILCAISHLLVTCQSQMCPFRQETHSLLVFIFQNHSSGSSSFDSSVGRAEDCRELKSSLGRWFESGSKDIFYWTFFFLKKIQAYVLLVNYYYYLGNWTLHMFQQNEKRIGWTTSERANEPMSERAANELRQTLWSISCMILT